MNRSSEHSGGSGSSRCHRHVWIFTVDMQLKQIVDYASIWFNVKPSPLFIVWIWSILGGEDSASLQCCWNPVTNCNDSCFVILVDSLCGRQFSPKFCVRFTKIISFLSEYVFHLRPFHPLISVGFHFEFHEPDDAFLTTKPFILSWAHKLNANHLNAFNQFSKSSRKKHERTQLERNSVDDKQKNEFIRENWMRNRFKLI